MSKLSTDQSSVDRTETESQTAVDSVTSKYTLKQLFTHLEQQGSQVNQQGILQKLPIEPSSDSIPLYLHILSGFGVMISCLMLLIFIFLMIRRRIFFFCYV